jgi:hypothetical protein
VKKVWHRTPENYDGTKLTAHRMSDLLPLVMSQIEDTFQDRPDLILTAWPEIIGPNLVAMTQAISFVEGVLTVKVKNSTLYSLLSRYDKLTILRRLRRRFPNVSIQDIVFRVC